MMQPTKEWKSQTNWQLKKSEELDVLDLIFLFMYAYKFSFIAILVMH